MTIRSKIFLLTFVTFLSIVLSGCISANTSIIVQSDGSGEVSTSIGLPIEFVALLASEGIDPIKELRQTLFRQIGFGVTFDQWDESDSEWLQLNRPFGTVDELNDIANAQPFVDNFNMQRQRSFLKDKFVLEARIVIDESSNLLSEEMGEVQALSDFDSNAPIDLKFSLQLPGRVVDTNGDYNNNTKTILWETNNSNTLEVQASSEKWNMLSIALTIALAVISIVLIAVIVILIIRIRRKRKGTVEDLNVSERLADSIQPDEEDLFVPTTDQTPVIPPSKILAMIGARELLEQVNSHVLNNRGNISAGKGAIRLVWRDQQDDTVTRGIMITVQDAETILVNGVPFPATREAAREGLISCLKGMTTQ